MMKPWKHYVPVQADLSDLKERYEWAESHQEEARRISGQATALIKSFGEKSAFESIFATFYEQPLRQIVNSYQPLTSGSYQKIIKQSGLRPVLKCGGHGLPCEELDTSHKK